MYSETKKNQKTCEGRKGKEELVLYPIRKWGQKNCQEEQGEWKISNTATLRQSHERKE